MVFVARVQRGHTVRLCVAECKEVTQLGCYGVCVCGRVQRGRTVRLLLWCVCGRVQRGHAVWLLLWGWGGGWQSAKRSHSYIVVVCVWQSAKRSRSSSILEALQKADLPVLESCHNHELPLSRVHLLNTLIKLADRELVYLINWAKHVPGQCLPLL